ncbi:hypothetical protein OSTOST_00065 [Ostertagia ostertagi]
MECLTLTGTPSPRQSCSASTCGPRVEVLRMGQAAKVFPPVHRDHCSGYFDPDENAVRSRSASFLFGGLSEDDHEKSNHQEFDKISVGIEHVATVRQTIV